MVSQRDIVLISFPFSNLQNSKVRPVLVMSNDGYNNKFDDFIVVPLTSNLKMRNHVLKLTNKDLETGTLIADSQIKTDRIFSVEKSLVKKKIGSVKTQIHKDVKRMIFEILD